VPRDVALDHGAAFLIDGNHVITVFEQDRFDRAADAAHDHAHVLQAGDVVVDGVHDQARRSNAAQLAAHEERQSIEFGERGPWVSGQARGGAVAAEHQAGDALANALVLDAVGKAFVEASLPAKTEAADERQQKRQAADPFCLSVFADNAGVIAFDETEAVCFKAETHNHPSAIEPYWLCIWPTIPPCSRFTGPMNDMTKLEAGRS